MAPREAVDGICLLKVRRRSEAGICGVSTSLGDGWARGSQDFDTQGKKQMKKEN